MNSNTLPSALCAQIAAHIPAALGAWTLEQVDEPCNWYANLIGTGGARLHIALRSDRLEVSGIYPQSPDRGHMSARSWGVLPYNETDPSMTVSATRPPEKIAADIARRLLPQYLKLYQACLERKADQEERERQRMERMQTLRLVAIAGGLKTSSHIDHPERWTGQDKETIYISAQDEGARLHVVVKVSTHDVMIECRSLTYEQAQNVIAALADPETTKKQALARLSMRDTSRAAAATEEA